MSKGKLFIVSAPSGCGKGTILSEVFKERNVYYSVSATTRKPREGEINGTHYFFMSDDEFRKTISEDGFLEYASFAGNSYGTPKKAVFDKLEEGVDVVLEIETQGAFQVKEKYPEAVMIFILPPHIEELRRRLGKRGTESEEVIERRVSQAAGEIEKSLRYDYVIMNDDLEAAVKDFYTVIEAAGRGTHDADAFKAENMKNTIKEVLEK